MAVQAAKVLNITLKLVDHDVVELPEIIDVPIVVHGFVFTEVILNKVNLYFTCNLKVNDSKKGQDKSMIL